MAAKEILTTLRSVSSSSLDALLLRPLLNLFGETVHERFIVLGNARTGSNYLLDGLASSKAIRTYHEIFASHQREIGQDFERVFSTLFRKERRGVRLVGCKVFYNHLTMEEWDRLVTHKEFKIIHLTRRNRLRTLISLDIAFKTGQWTRSALKRTVKPEERMVTMDVSKLIDRIDRIRDEEELARKIFGQHQVLEIVYEDMVARPLETFDRIGAFLSVEDIDPSQIHIRRQNPEKLERLITNYNEVKQTLTGTPYEAYLDE